MTYAPRHQGDAVRGEVATDRATAALDNVARRLWRARGEGHLDDVGIDPGRSFTTGRRPAASRK